MTYILSGHPGRGKSTVAMHDAREAMEGGRHVIWLDYEIGARRTAERMQAVGIAAELAAERLHYAPFPEFKPDGDEALQAAIVRWPGALVVLDSLGHALASAGLNENENADALQWATSTLFPAKEAGATGRSSGCGPSTARRPDRSSSSATKTG